MVPSVALSGSDLLPGCVEAERMVEFKGPTGAWVNGAPSSSSESERAVMIDEAACALGTSIFVDS